VAFGTSSPELVINVFAATKGNTGISFGNIFGSNIINILLVLGVAGLFTTLRTAKNTVWREIPFLVLAIIATFVLCNDKLFNGSISDILSLSDGIILLLFFIIFLAYLFIMSKATAENTPKIQAFSISKTVIYLAGGLLALILGGKLTVDSAVVIAKSIGMSDRIIGLTIIAIGSSLPELFTTVVAARKGHHDIAIGNAIGSSIFNLLFILPITAIITPLTFSPELNLDIFVMFIASFFLFVTMFTGKKRILDRWEAIGFIVIYLVYLTYLIVN
jgi:cation:H+ antiporter